MPTAPAGPLADVLMRMDAVRAGLADAGDDAALAFLAVYRRTTVSVGLALERGRFADPGWVVRWDTVFAGFYLDAVEAHLAGLGPTQPWAVALGAPADLPPLRAVLLGMNAHINLDLPQSLLAVIPPEELDDPDVLARRRLDHARIDDVLAEQVSREDARLRGSGLVGVRDRVLAPLSRAAVRRFLPESRARVWRNTLVLDAARRRGPQALAERVEELERLTAARVRDLLAPGQVLLRLARRGFGVDLPA